MNRVIAIIVSLALVALSFVVLTRPAVAQAIPVGVRCEAASPYAYGVWVASDVNYACARALQQCAARTPYGATCYVTRWYYVY